MGVLQPGPKTAISADHEYWVYGTRPGLRALSAIPVGTDFFVTGPLAPLVQPPSGLIYYGTIRFLRL